MAKTYTITLSDAEDKALSVATVSQQEWIDNAVKERARIAKEEIINISVKKALESGIAIPSTEEEIVNLAFSNSWVKTLAQITEETQARFDTQQSTQSE
jgi:hypothetical protein